MNKLQKWKSLETQLEKTVDAIGYPIDKGIKETVVAFNAYGFPTFASCEGHLDHSLASPWIDIWSEKKNRKLRDKANTLFKKAQELDKEGKEKESMNVLRQAEVLQKKVNLPIMKLSEKLIETLSDFYKNRNTPYDTRLTVHQFSDITRIECIGGFLQEIRTPKEKKKKLKEYQKEIKDFGEFLKKKYFNE